jgi:hypothetical protein
MTKGPAGYGADVTSRAEFLAQDRALVARVSEVRGCIEDMPDDERVFMLGALTGALERHLAWAGAAEEGDGG